LIVSLVIAVMAGCASVEPRGDFARAREIAARSTGIERLFNPEQTEADAAYIERCLEDGLTADEAARIALLLNPQLQGAFFEIGISRADVVQSGLLSNPSLGIALQLPAGGGLANLEAGIAQNIADLWRIPIRKRAAKMSLNRTILGIARHAAILAADTKAAYFEAVGADTTLLISRENFAVAQNLLELALIRQEAGAASELDVNLSRSLALDAELDVGAARLAAANARRELAKLLGVRADADLLTLLDPLPEAPSGTLDGQRLLELAQSWRLDIRSARHAIEAAALELQVEQRRRIPNIEIGVALERGERGRSEGGREILADTARASIAGGGLTAPDIQPRSERRRNTDFIIGPSLELEIPIFDQNQAQIAKARYAHEQAIRTLEALEQTVSHEVRGAIDRTLTAWSLVRIYQERSIPLAQSNLDLSREAYRAGRTSFLSVLEAQRFYLEARNRHIEASKTAAVAIPDLERIIGLPVAELMKEVKAAAANEPGTEEETNQ
jgi:cobalt-zinc-cadmium efflux system outer membrane protein